MLAYDEKTGEQAYKPVVQLFRNTTEEWQYVYIEGETEPIISTPGHKYYLPENSAVREDGRPQEHASYSGLSERWVSACSLKKGDKVLLSDGKYGIVEKTVCVKLAAPETTYNLEVSDFHTYYVGNKRVLVHNTDCSKPKTANRGSTGRTEPNNLVEKLAMEQVKSDPLNGAKVLGDISLKDTRWLSSEGWVKMQSVVRSGSHQTTIHFVYNQTLNLVDDFKFVGFKVL